MQKTIVKKDKCRFPHIKPQQGQEVCYQCGNIFMSKTDLINHIKTQHGMVICHKFLRNECSHSSDECIFTHKTMPNAAKSSHAPNRSQQQGFWQAPIPPLHSPTSPMLNMSEHIQNKLQIQSPQGRHPLQVNILEMIPQIVSQVLILLTQQASQ